ncbi:MAG TPA: Lpg1974 family pore-forming outer membrane protein, partial [Candidatus Polarisedimenticolia bacterium]|nr:Lpg1974 family pore-forming outer membrane protein [Candidatus Polarisedimenticolia bacterium]
SSSRLPGAGRAAVAFAVTAIALAAASPARAGDIDYKGWFVALDAALTQPTGLDQHYATALDRTTFQQQFLYLDNDAGVSGEARIGYSWGTLGGLSLSYWTFDNDDSLTQSDTANYIYPTVFGGIAYNAGEMLGLGVYPAVQADYTVDSSVKASTFDLEYSRPMEAGEHFNVTWLAGLRSVTFEEDLAFDGTDAYPGYPALYQQTRHIESDGVGLKVGAVLDFGFTKHFSLQAKMAFSFLRGSMDAVTTQTATSFFGFPPVYETKFDSLTISQDNVRGEIRDYDLRAVWSWKSFDFYVGYGGSTWEGLVKDPTGDNFSGSATLSDGADRDSMTFDSAHAGIVLRLGGG